jgi:predicted restriction endonuclease
LDLNNGILLSPNIDYLFDKHSISFQDDGFIIISNKIEDENLNKLGIVKTIKIEVNSDMKTYLKYHRNKFYETQK